MTEARRGAAAAAAAGRPAARDEGREADLGHLGRPSPRRHLVPDPGLVRRDPGVHVRDPLSTDIPEADHARLEDTPTRRRRDGQGPARVPLRGQRLKVRLVTVHHNQTKVIMVK